MTNLKNYAMALVALVIAATSVTLMSFNQLNPSTSQWYEVGEFDGNGHPIGQSMDPPSGDCDTQKPNDICAVELDGTPPAYLEEVSGTPNTAGRSN